MSPASCSACSCWESLTRRVGQPAALVGVLAGVSAVTYAKFGTALAWPWFALVGSSTVFAVGLVASLVVSGEAMAKTIDIDPLA